MPHGDTPTPEGTPSPDTEKAAGGRAPVWFVMEHHDYEGSDVVSVHATETSANLERDRLQELMDHARQRRQAWLDSEDETEAPWPDGVPDCDTLTVSGPWEVHDDR